MAPIADETPPTAASADLAIGYPFFSAIRLANAAARNSATCKGPLAASMPKSTIVDGEQERSERRSAAGHRAGLEAGPDARCAVPGSIRAPLRHRGRQS